VVCCRYEDKEVQRDKKLVSYDITDKQGKPYVKVQVGKEEKVRMRDRKHGGG
jgi:heat shock protein 5